MTPDIIAALEAFAAYADPRRSVPASMPVTSGSSMARKQLTMGDCYAAADALAALSTSPAGQEVLPDCITNGDVEAWIFSHQDKDADMEAARMALFRFRSSLSSAQPAVTEENGGHCYCWCHPNAGAIGCSPCCDAEDNYLPPSKRDPALSSVEPAGNGREALELCRDVLPRFVHSVSDEDKHVAGRAALRVVSAALSSPPAAVCAGCEGRPAPENDPCAVCGRAAAEQEAVRLGNKERNRIINRASFDLDVIIRGHDPEIHNLNNRVWDRLDRMALEIETLYATPPAPALDGVEEAMERIRAAIDRWMPSGADESRKARMYDDITATLSSPSEGESAPASSGAGDAFQQKVKPWYEVDAHRDLSRLIPDMEGKIADAKKRYAHCLPDHLFAPLEASISELKVLRYEVAGLPTSTERGR